MQVRGQSAGQIWRSPMPARWLRWARTLQAWRRRLLLHVSRALMTLVRQQTCAPQVPRHPAVCITQPQLFVSLLFRNYMPSSSKSERGDGTALQRMTLPPSMVSQARGHFVPTLAWRRVLHAIHHQPMLFSRDETRPQAVGPTYRQELAPVQPISLSSRLQLVSRRAVSAEHIGMEPTAGRLRSQTKRQEWTREGRPSLVVHQPERRVATPERSGPSDVPAAMPAFDGRQVDAEWAAAPALSVLNVDSLTNEVIRHIDRRIVAQRERMGRV